MDTVLLVLPFVVIVALGAGFWFVFRQRSAMRRERRRAADRVPKDPRQNGHARRPR